MTSETLKETIYEALLGAGFVVIGGFILAVVAMHFYFDDVDYKD